MRQTDDITQARAAIGIDVRIRRDGMWEDATVMGIGTGDALRVLCDDGQIRMIPDADWSPLGDES